MSNVYKKGILKIFFSTALVQLINILLLPVYSRVFSPEDFGILGTVTASTAIIAALSGLKYEQAIMVSNNKLSAINLFILSNIISISLNIIIFLILFFLDIKSVYLFIPLIAYLAFLTESLYSLYSRLKDFGAISTGKIVGTIYSNATKLTTGFSVFNLQNGLVIGQMIGVLTPALYLFFVRKKILIIIRSYKNKLNFFRVAKKKVAYPKYYLPQGSLNVLTHNLPPLVLALYFNEYEIGLYWFCVRILQIPISLISDSIRKVMTVKLSSIKNDIDLLSSTWLQWTLGLSAISLTAITFIYLLSDLLIPLLFGKEWTGAVLYSKWLVLYVVSGLIILPTVSSVMALNKLKFQLNFEVIQFFVVVICLGCSILVSSLYAFVVAYSISRLILSVGFAAIFHKLTMSSNKAKALTT
ncbi:oligosaccharide flippase family protein [Vibrio chagasii]|uniref:oligosaccharide flippase family protein n=1 Tax=Vibrio chagasii TaxID=170679 RepID=UPI003BB7DE81